MKIQTINDMLGQMNRTVKDYSLSVITAENKHSSLNKKEVQILVVSDQRPQMKTNLQYLNNIRKKTYTYMVKRIRYILRLEH